MAGTSAGAKGWMAAYIVTALLLFVPVVTYLAVPILTATVGRALGWMLRKKTEGRRIHLVALMDEANGKSRASTNDEWEKVSHANVPDGAAPLTSDEKWDGIVGFFHPFCNAGGGGERVLWGAIQATQARWPRAKCVVYTGDHDATKDAILARVKDRFNIPLHAPTITFLYLSKRHWVLPSTWPRFTLLGQSIGSVILGWDAFSLLVPDIFIDTMGFTFALGLSKFLFRNIPTGAYVHYPSISTDMLESLDPGSKDGSQGINAGKGVGLRGAVKRNYWQLFARLYSWVGATVDVVMTNSTWTQHHIKTLWGPYRTKRDKAHPLAVVYPPVAVEEMEREVEVSAASEKKRKPFILYLAQFRPEKNHQLIIQSFAKFVKSGAKAAKDARLVLLGSVRDDNDSKRVYQLRLLVNELHIKDQVDFQLDAPWSEVLEWLRISSVGVNGMWNEHFGIGVVEYQAAGLISVVHDSGGPKLDIVKDIDGGPTGFHATSAAEFAEGYDKALSVANPLAMRQRARKSAKRFTEEEFAIRWLEQMDRMVALRRRK